MWNLLVIEPMVNALMWLYSLFNNNFVLALAVFTLAVRFAMLPMTLKQQKATMKQQEMQPQIQAIQKKYRDNPQKMQEEFQKIGYNPADTLMGCLPLVIQMPIFFGLYRAIFLIMGSTPLSVLQLTERIYPSIASLVDLPNVLPITNNFLWLNMAQP
ncbi:MAG: membrane protein insertase YidC, partial [Anaerolineales bacterium]|nr:membrane protein insertase YidC [Anaerolineales bacterium]